MEGTETRITPDLAGCWLDGHYGWHNTYRVVAVARAYGFTLSADDEAMIGAYERQESAVTLPCGTALDEASINEHAIELSDEATDYLQSLAPDGFVFQWDTGELLLLSEDDADGF